MTACAALLRAVNVGGTGKLPMSDLKAMGEACGFADVRTYIASGNLLFRTGLAESSIKAVLEDRLATYAGKRVAVLVRTGRELADIVAANPFPDAHPSRHLVYFYDAPLPEGFVEGCRDINGERLAAQGRQLHVDYGEGIRFTKLKMPKLGDHTARSINTVSKLAQLLV